MKKKIKDNEIDLVEILLNIWEGKFIIISAISLTIILTLGYNIINKKTFTATSKVNQISIFEEDYYQAYNNLIKMNNPIDLEKDNSDFIFTNDLPIIDKILLLNLFLEELRNPEIIKEAIIKFELIDKKKYKNKLDYDLAVEKKALQVNLNSYKIDEDIENKINWTIEFKTSNPKKWEDALKYINLRINEKIRSYLLSNFKLSIKNQKILRNIKIEKINFLIKNLSDEFNEKKKRRLSFLNEQATIAKELGVKNIFLMMQEGSIPNYPIDINDTNYYLHGYLKIEKEIQFLKSRPTSIQILDKDILNLKREKQILLKNKFLENAEILFLKTPIKTNNNFKSASIIFNDTKFISEYSLKKALLLAIFIGLIFGVFYVLIGNAIKQRKR